MMTEIAGLTKYAALVLWVVSTMAITVAGALLVERAALSYEQMRRRRLGQRYIPLVRRALDGDAGATDSLVSSPARHRIDVAGLLILPLIHDRSDALIERTRAIVQAMSLRETANQYLRSWWWWRRAVALRSLGLLRVLTGSAEIVAALDDPHPDVRAAALDALADLNDPATLRAIVVRLHDVSLHRGRRLAALASFGAQAEPLVLELAEIDPANRFRYARALAICGTARCRPILCEWATDGPPDLRATALEALAHAGLDERAAHVALDSLSSADEIVRAKAAYALRGWQGPDATTYLARHLDDTWTVAVEAARALQSIRPVGLAALQSCASRPGLDGQLARQMLWEVQVH